MISRKIRTATTVARLWRALALFCIAASFSAVAVAHADDSPPVRRNPELERAIKAVKAQDFKAAVDMLTSYVAENPKDADAFNYLGFSYRKLGNLDLAVKNYNTALAIDPDHKGAHEYLGETLLLMNDLPKAKEHLARLDKICWLGCEEYDDLKKAVAAYEAQHKS